MAKSVDAVDSKSTVEIRAGSSPAFGTIKYRANKKPPKGGFFVPEGWSDPASEYDPDIAENNRLQVG